MMSIKGLFQLIIWYIPLRFARGTGEPLIAGRMREAWESAEKLRNDPDYHRYHETLQGIDRLGMVSSISYDIYESRLAWECLKRCAETLSIRVPKIVIWRSWRAQKLSVKIKAKILAMYQEKRDTLLESIDKIVNEFDDHILSQLEKDDIKNTSEENQG